MVIWGRNPVLEALRSGRSIEKIFIAHDTTLPRKIVEEAKKRGVKVQRVSRKRIEEMAETKKTQGVLAILSPVTYTDEDILLKEVIEKDSFVIVADHITDPQNLGNIIRTCEVFGGHGVIIPKDRSSPVNETVVKASAGAVFHIKIAKVTNLSRTIEKFKNMGGWVFAVEKGGKDIREAEMFTPSALVLGSEGEGVSKKLLNLADFTVSIPMAGKVSSLNVSNACAIAVWELVRGKI